jgi:hypothetical protein
MSDEKTGMTKKDMLELMDGAKDLLSTIHGGGTVRITLLGRLKKSSRMLPVECSSQEELELHMRAVDNEPDKWEIFQEFKYRYIQINSIVALQSDGGNTVLMGHGSDYLIEGGMDEFAEKIGWDK